MKDQTFSVQPGVHQVAVDGKIVPAEWGNLGAAIAGLAVERRRAAARALKQGKTPAANPRYRQSEILQICADHPYHMADHVAHLYREIDRLTNGKSTCEQRGGCFGGDCCLK
jgi:hypothetical protein